MITKLSLTIRRIAVLNQCSLPVCACACACVISPKRSQTDFQGSCKVSVMRQQIGFFDLGILETPEVVPITGVTNSANLLFQRNGLL